MHTGVYIFATDYAIRIDELAVELEARGFESLFVPEHTHIPASRKSPWPGGGDLPKDYWHTHDPFVSLMAAAAKTERLKVGTGICLLPQHEPIATAKAAASLDFLSDGRFIFGIGGGWNVEEMANHGVNYKTRFRQMREHVLAMKALWTEEQSEFHGEFVNFDAVWSYPKPVTQPHPPILLGGETRYTLDRVVEYCDGWLPRARGGFEPAAEMARLAQAAEAGGRDPASIGVTVFGAPAKADVLEAYAAAGIERALFQLHSKGRDDTLRRLDELAPHVA